MDDSRSRAAIQNLQVVIEGVGVALSGSTRHSVVVRPHIRLLVCFSSEGASSKSNEGGARCRRGSRIGDVASDFVSDGQVRAVSEVELKVEGPRRGASVSRQRLIASIRVRQGGSNAPIGHCELVLDRLRDTEGCRGRYIVEVAACYIRVT